jgi:hypothetical protein
MPNDMAAKRYACQVADEINRNAKHPLPVLIFDQQGTLLAAVRPIEE